jgi:hypothetical protein
MNPSRRPFSRFEKTLLFGVPILLIFLLGGAAMQAKINDAPGVVFPTPVPTPNPNGLDLYLEAANAITPANPAVDAVNDPKNLLQTDPQLAAQQFSLARKKAWLGANAAGFALFEEALAAESRHRDTRGQIGGFIRYSPFRQLARDKVVEVHALTLQKKWPEAVDSSLDIIEMGSDIGRGAPMMGKLVGSAIISLGRAPLTDNQFLPEKLDAASARAAATRLEAILKNRPTYKAALEEERWVTLSNFLTVSKDPKWRDASSYERKASWRDQVATHVISKQTIVAQINRSFDLRLADFALPWKSPDTPQPITNPIVRMFQASNFPRSQEATELVPSQILLLRFALRAYRLENGAFPAKLDDLAPKYLQQIPKDIFADRAPFRYRVKNGDYELWSIGPDGKDDGGVPLKWNNGASGANEIGAFPRLNYLSRRVPAPSGDYVARRNS